MLNDLRWNLVRPQGMEAVMRVRVSQVGACLRHVSPRLRPGSLTLCSRVVHQWPA